MIVKLKELASAAVNFFLPPFCVVCNTRQRGWPSTPVCDSCWSAFLSDDMGGRMPVPDRSYAFTKFRARYLMTDEFQKAVHALKYNKMPSIGRKMGWELGAFIPTDFWSQMDAIVPVPLYHTRMRERGYNQAEMIAIGLSESTGLNVLKKALKRTRDTGTQTALDKSKRAYNVEKAFEANPALVKGKRILLVDDVVTTGSTTDECAKALLTAGALEVRVASAARA
ncbi:MAG: ComF family protein [Fibrobacteres bacterium]|nr:ComF family protein [Fibrobacterota bacterium]